MGILSSLLLSPIKGPIDGALWVAGKIHEDAERQWSDPAVIRTALASLEGQFLAGEISETQYDEAETELLLRLKGAS